MAAAPTFLDLKEQAEAHALSLRPRLAFAAGTLPDLIAGAIAAVGDRIVSFSASGIRDTYIDLAIGEQLTIVCNDRYSIQRSPGGYATTDVTLTRSSGAAGGGTIAAGSRFATVTDAVGVSYVFTATEDVVVAGAALTATVPVRAEQLGRGYNVADSTITRVLDTLYDPLWTVNNLADAAGGADPDTDDELRDRVRGQSLAWRRGTAVAIAYVARQVAGVATVTVVEGATGLVAIYIADADGNSNATLNGNVNDAVEADGAAAGAAWFVQGGTVQLVPIDITLTVPSDMDAAAIVTRVRAAVVARWNKLKHGEVGDRDLIKQATLNAGGDRVRCVVNDPPANLEPAANVILKTTTGLVTFT